MSDAAADRPSVTFEGTVTKQGRTMTFIELPFDVRKTFDRSRPPLVVTIGEHTYRTTVEVVEKSSRIPLDRVNREAAGVEPKETVEVTVVLDDGSRDLQPSKEFASALRRDRIASRAFDKMSDAEQAAYIEWINSAKREDTQTKRVLQAIDRLRANLRAPT